MSGKQQCVKVLMFPWLAHGHISPFTELAKRLIVIQRNVHVFLCSTSVNLEPLRKSIDEPSIEFVNFHLSTTELPEIYHTTRNLPSHLMPVLKTAFDDSKESFRSVVKTVKPDIIIYDFIPPWAPQVADEEGIASIILYIFCAASIALLAHYIIHPEMEYPFESMRLSETERKLCDVIDMVTGDAAGRDRFLGPFERSSTSFILIHSSNQVEADYIGYLSKLMKTEVVPTGFLVQEPAAVESGDDVVLLNWLSKKNPKSVVLVSFGSESFLSKKEMEELGLGLESSGVSFIWVVRFAVGEKMSLDEALPKGFIDRVGDRGLIVEGWAPQAKILTHSSVGGFVSHCGWSSILEAITYGVPVICMARKLDHPITSKLVVELGIGVEVRRDGEEFTRGEIAKAIKKVVVEEEGREIGRKVDTLRDEVRRKRDVEINAAVQRIVQLAQA
ncbi:flavanone 7-O-glucoside 2''-O-beta-L-rhamnosyltransferase [Dorcoceras hygrometricum]|uniref:Glycosyltransferase n=2 Tax=Dorcoceras hygrometricum TaxID=472368 RepID=A0A2Z7BYG7_9LAMI|nr:flavanone 7-O-glucoside 2''-O-beta-L-rhamnosyltransferase [Dorcoceras hygrometricum]